MAMSSGADLVGVLPSMLLQKGQLRRGLLCRRRSRVCWASRKRLSEMRWSPASSSFQNWAPPAPQQKEFSRLRGSSGVEFREDVEEVAGGVVDVVVAAEVAGVVIGDGRFAGRGGEPFVGDEGFEVFGVVEDFVVAADLLVLVADGVHAVGAGGDDEFGLDGVEGGDVFVGELAVEVLVAGAAGGVSGAALTFAEDGEVDVGVVEEFDEGAGGFLGCGIVAGGAAYPVEDVGGGIFVGGFDVEAVGPGEALLVVDAPGVLGALHAAEGGLELRGEFAFDHDLMAADVDDVEHLLVLGGADLEAGSAGGAGPGGFGGEGEWRRGWGLGWSFFKGCGGEAEWILSAASRSAPCAC